MIAVTADLAPTGRSWTIVADGLRPWSLNTERRWHPLERARHVAEWRGRFLALTYAHKIPKLERVRITSWALLSDRRWIPDTASHIGATKCGVDALVDAKVLDDDDPETVPAIVFLAPVVGDRDGLVLIVEELGP